VPQGGGAPATDSVARQVPAAGAATSANQYEGGPPSLAADLAATLPSGAISESDPCSGFSAATRTCKGAPFQGDSGAARIAIWAACSQLADELSAQALAAGKTENAAATSTEAVAAGNRRARSNVSSPL